MLVFKGFQNFVVQEFMYCGEFYCIYQLSTTIGEFLKFSTYEGQGWSPVGLGGGTQLQMSHSCCNELSVTP